MAFWALTVPAGLRRTSHERNARTRVPVDDSLATINVTPLSHRVDADLVLVVTCLVCLGEVRDTEKDKLMAKLGFRAVGIGANHLLG